MRILSFTPVTAAITDPVTKFGGRPNWLSVPQWPLSRATGRPMRFICQVALPPAIQHGGQKMAYVFMTDDDGDDYDGAWEPESGENAVVLQPAPFECLVETSPLDSGPTLRKRVEEPRSLLSGLWWQLGSVKLVDVELSIREVEADPGTHDLELQSRIGGEPGWLQNDETPSGAWDLIIQIDSTGKAFDINFGDGGVGYAFIRRDGRAGRFLWQCC